MDSNKRPYLASQLSSLKKETESGPSRRGAKRVCKAHHPSSSQSTLSRQVNETTLQPPRRSGGKTTKGLQPIDKGKAGGGRTRRRSVTKKDGA